MATIHAKRIGHESLISHDELERLVELARQVEEVELRVSDEEVTERYLTRLAEQSGAFDFWYQEGEDIYSVEDGEPV